MKITIERISKWKIWFDRARTYVGYIQFLATAYIVVKLLKNSPLKTWVFDNWYISFPLIFVVFFGLCMVLGWLESLLKIREFEQANYSKANPEWMKLIEQLEQIKKLLNEKDTR
jgi:hypothetical protein